MTTYYVTFSNPDGHMEENEQTFNTRGEAIEYGASLLNQVRATEATKKQGLDSEIGLAYFLVYEVTDGQRRLIFNSLR